MIPENLKYTREHEWVLVGDNCRVGITDYAQSALGDIVYVQLPAVGDVLTAGATCGEVESTKSVSELYAPLSGRVISINDQVVSTPEMINTDPYGQGWLFEIEPSDAGQISALLEPQSYADATAAG